MREQCSPCPWRQPADLPEYAVVAAREDHQFVCHTRCGPCPGPVLARIAPKKSSQPKENT